MCEYIINNPDEVIYFSIANLAAKCQIGNATIIRLCKKLGFKGYQEFKVALAQEISFEPEDNVFSGPIHKGFYRNHCKEIL